MGGDTNLQQGPKSHADSVHCAVRRAGSALTSPSPAYHDTIISYRVPNTITVAVTVNLILTLTPTLNLIVTLTLTPTLTLPLTLTQGVQTRAPRPHPYARHGPRSFSLDPALVLI